ncbi:MAG: PHP domain-containing protein [Candidatus Eremiobacterota bacterium]
MITELHCHTTASDGTLAPAELLELAVSRGVRILCITDHDTMAAYPEARAAARDRLELWTGIEINCDDEIPGKGGVEVHVLGYFIDPEHGEFRRALDDLRSARQNRIQEMVQRLNDVGVEVTAEEARAESSGPSLGRPHLARALVRKGLVPDVNDAFDRYLAIGQVAYVPRYNLKPLRAISLIRAAGGLPVLAHPGLMGTDELIASYVQAGLAGLEVYYPRHTPEQVAGYENLAARYGLLRTGGSDFHGPGHGAEVGSVELPSDALDALREASARC